jgi:hypothetical protein
MLKENIKFYGIKNLIQETKDSFRLSEHEKIQKEIKAVIKSYLPSAIVKFLSTLTAKELQTRIVITKHTISLSLNLTSTFMLGALLLIIQMHIKNNYNESIYFELQSIDIDNIKDVLLHIDEQDLQDIHEAVESSINDQDIEYNSVNIAYNSYNELYLDIEFKI